MKRNLNKVLALSIVFVFSLVLFLGTNTVYSSAIDTPANGKVSVQDMSLMAKNTKSVDLFLTMKGTRAAELQSKIEILSYSHGISSPRDSASGLATGKRMHKPFVITKELDKSTPLLMKMLITNETIPELTLTIAEPNSKSPFTITLKNASIASIDMSSGLDGGSSAKEEITLTYQKIEWSWGTSNTTATDDWTVR